MFGSMRKEATEEWIKSPARGGYRKVQETLMFIPLDLHADRWTLEHNKIKIIL